MNNSLMLAKLARNKNSAIESGILTMHSKLIRVCH